jgi:DNA-binding transcriptional regulator YdaS (Cro superfamily)
MELREWVVAQTENGKYACMERVYEDMSARLGVGTGSVRQWVTGHREVGAKHVLKIEKITDGKVSGKDLRSDIYPD